MTAAAADSAVTRTIPGRSWESSQVIKYLQDKPMGHLATYADLSEVTRRQIPGDGRHFVSSALRYLEREGQIWRNVENVGYRRLDNPEIVDEGVRVLGVVRRRARRVGRVVAAADREKLSPEQIATADRAILSQRVVEMFLGPRGQKKLGGLALEAKGRALPPVEDALEAFRK